MRKATKLIACVLMAMALVICARPFSVMAEAQVDVATIGDARYASLEAAFADAKEGETIRLLSDAALDDAIEFHSGSSIVLDLAGHNIGYLGGDASCLFDVSANGTLLTIIDSSPNKCGLIGLTDSSSPNASVFRVGNGATLIISGGTIHGGDHCVDAAAGSTVSIFGAILSDSAYSVIRSSGASIEIGDGACVACGSGCEAIELLGGDRLAISGGEVCGDTCIHQIANSTGRSTIAVSGGTVICDNKASGNAAIIVESLATIEVTGGTVGSYHDGNGIVSTGNSTITVSNGQVIGNEMAAIETHGVADVAVIGGTVASDGAGGNGMGILHCADGTVTIGVKDDPSSSSPIVRGVVSGILMKAGTLNVYGGEIGCGGYDTNAYEGGVVINSDESPVRASIEGGIVIGPYGVYEFGSVDGTSVTITGDALIGTTGSNGSAISSGNDVVSLDGGYVSDKKPSTVEALPEGRALRQSVIYEGYYEVFEPVILLAAESVTYTGSEYAGEVTVFFHGQTLSEDAYELSYVDAEGNAITAPSDAGVYAVAATPAAGAAWSGSVRGAFEIQPVDITACDVATSDKVYDGAPKTIDGISFGGYELTEGVDYDIAYTRNTLVGTASATITGRGNFCGTQKVSFRILPESMPVYRLYNPWSGEHFFTMSARERRNLVEAGWTYEGVGWNTPLIGQPVYRLYNPWAAGGDHHYTMDETEYEHLQEAGWIDEGICWYSDSQERVPVWREYNPWQFAHNHNCTAGRAEHDHLIDLGWNDEGIGWYGV